MSDIAEMMQDGTLCSSCGAYIESEANGFPRECEGCEDKEQ